MAALKRMDAFFQAPVFGIAVLIDAEGRRGM